MKKKDKNPKTESAKAILQRIVPLTALILIVIGFIAYSNSFHATFHWDDVPQIKSNEKVHDLSTFADPGTWSKVNLRPFSLFTLSLNWAVGETNVFGYHLVNLLLHILTAFIVFLLTRFTIGLLIKEEQLDQRYKDVISLFMALLFLLHPVQTMAVTYIVQRMAILAALFYLLAVLLYARGRIEYLTNGLNRRSLGFLVLAFIAGMMGVLSKQNAVTFPAAFLLYELFFIRKSNGEICKKYLLSGTGLLLLGFFVVLITGSLPSETGNFSRMEYLSAQFGIFYKYILLVILPINQNADYFIRVEAPLWGIAQFIGLAIVLGLMALGVYLFKRNKLISFGIFWIFLSMSIESGLIPIRDIMMEHRMYLPMFGIGFIMAGIIMQYVRFRSANVVYILGVLLLCIMAFATYERNKAWKTSITLWEDCLEKNPDNPRAMSNLGLAVKVNAKSIANPQLKKAEFNKAIQLFTSSLKCDTIFVKSYVNRSLAYLELDEYERAMRDVMVAAEKSPKEEYMKRFVEGVILAKKGSLDKAMRKFNEVIKMKKDFAPAYRWRGLVYAEKKEFESAIGNYKLSLMHDPSQLELYMFVSNVFQHIHDYTRALKWMNKAEEMGYPQNVNVNNKRLLKKAIEESENQIN